MSELICIDCGKERDLGHTRCKKCFRVYKNNYYKDKTKLKGRYRHSCILCEKVFSSHRKESNICQVCLKNNINKDCSKNKYDYLGLVNKKQTYTHRKLAELIIKRNLQTNEFVHHLDENTQNNEVTNLIILDRRSHNSLHHFLRKYKLIVETFTKYIPENVKDNILKAVSLIWLESTKIRIIKLWEINYDEVYVTNSLQVIINKPSKTMKMCKFCKKDFKVIRNTQKYCSDLCRNLANRKQINRPTKEELQQLIKTHPFTTLAKMYGVSDNAIRKWCKSYNLFYKKKDLKNESSNPT